MKRFAVFDLNTADARVYLYAIAASNSAITMPSTLLVDVVLLQRLTEKGWQRPL